MRKVILLLFLFLPAILIAQDSIEGRAYFGGNDLVLGQIFFLEIEVSAPKSAQVQLPDLAPNIKGLEVGGAPSTQQFIDNNKSFIHKRRYPYIAFDSVSGMAGPFDIHYIDYQGKNQVLKIPAIALTVGRIPVDTADALRIAYGPISKGETDLWRAFFFVLALLVLITIIILISKWIKGGKKLSIPDDVDPRVWALQQIETLQQQIPFQDHKMSWVQLVDTLRLYLEKAWKVPAPYFSTGELLGAIAKNQHYSSQLSQVSEVLEIGDQIKFAKRKSTVEEQNEAIRKTKSIILFNPSPSISLDSKEEGDHG